MRTLFYSLIAAALVFASGAAPASAQNNAKEIMAKKPAELVEILKNPKASTFEKAKAAQRLAVVGTKDAVPALAALLPDEKLNDYARFGLEGISDPAADQALRDAAAKLHGRPLVGVLDSIGQRRDAKAVELLADFLYDKDAAVASAAAGALGRIGTPEAAEQLTLCVAVQSPVQLAAADACLVCADRLGAAGKKDEAVFACRVVLESIGAMEMKDIPNRLKAAAVSGYCRHQKEKEEALELLVRLLQSPKKDYFNVALTMARQMPGAEATEALGDVVEKLPPERQSLLILAIGDRKDSAPMSLFLAAVKSPSAAVREAAIRALVKRGDASVLTTLLDAAIGDAAVAQVAKDGLTHLPGKDVDAAVLARWDDADANAKVVLLDLIGARQIVAALLTVREAMADADQRVRLSAFAAMAQLIDVRDLNLLIDKALARDGKPAEIAMAKSALETAANRMGDRDGCAAKLAKRLAGDSPAARSYLLELLCKVGGRKALAAVVAGAKSADPATKDAATRVLGKWASADAAPALLDIAKNDPEKKYRIRALRGYIRIARQLESPWWEETDVDKTKLAMFDTAMKIAKRKQEKSLALDILTRIPSATALERAAAWLDDAATRDAATDAALKIAPKVVRDNPKAVVAAMQKIVGTGIGGRQGDSANQVLAKQLLDQAKAASK